MLIRSQNKQNIYNFDLVSGIGFSEYNTPCHMYVLVKEREYLLGKYSTKEKSIKVLYMIQNQYQYIQECKYIGVGCCQPEFVFQMPQDDEVEA